MDIIFSPQTHLAHLAAVREWLIYEEMKCARPINPGLLLNAKDGADIDLTNEPNNEFPFAKLWHVDAKANGTEDGSNGDDVNSDTIFGGLATIIVGIVMIHP